MKINRNPSVEVCIAELQEMLQQQKDDFPELIQLGLLDRKTANQKHIAIASTIKHLQRLQEIEKNAAKAVQTELFK